MSLRLAKLMFLAPIKPTTIFSLAVVILFFADAINGAENMDAPAMSLELSDKNFRREVWFVFISKK